MTQIKTEQTDAKTAPSEATAALIHWEKRVNEMASGVLAPTSTTKLKTER